MCPIVVSKILHIYTNEISFSQLQECNAAQPCIALVISEAEYKKRFLHAVALSYVKWLTHVWATGTAQVNFVCLFIAAILLLSILCPL